jgi:hypothetical protein
MMMVASRFRSMRFAGILLIALLTFGCATYPYQEDPDIDDNGRFGTWDGGSGAYYDSSVSLFEETGGADWWYPGSDEEYYERTVGYDPQGYWRH